MSILKTPTLNAIYESADLIDQVRELDQRLNLLKKQAELFVNDMDGYGTVTTILFKVKDMVGFKQQLEEIKEEPTSDPHQHPILGMIESIHSNSTVTSAEYKAHEDNTDQSVFHLNPQEALILIESLKNILMTKRNVIITELESMFPKLIEDKDSV